MVVGNPIINYPGAIFNHLYNLFTLGIFANRRIWQLIIICFFSFFLFSSLAKCLYPQWSAVKLWRRKVTSPTLFILMVCIGILILRLPSLLSNAENPDENVYIVEAASFLKGAKMWKTLFAGTSGPLIFEPLAVFSYLGGINYASIRLFGIACCILPSVFFFWKSVCLVIGELPARITSILLFLFFGGAVYGDFVAYSSEYVPVLLLSVAIYYYCKILSSGSVQSKYLFISGLLLGLTPYAKLQSVPIAICIGMLAIFEVYQIHRTAGKILFYKMGVFAVGGLLPTIVVAIYLTANKCWASFFENYIFSNLSYLNNSVDNSKLVHLSSWQIFKNSFQICTDMKGYYLYTGGIFVLTVVACFLISHFPSGRQVKMTIIATLFLISSFLSIFLPGRNFSHYFLFGFFPIAFVMASLINLVIQGINRPLYKKIYLAMIALILVLFCNSILKRYTLQRFLKPKSNYELSDISKCIKKYAAINEKMMIWGWVEGYFVETGLVMGGFCTFPSDVMNCNPATLDGMTKMAKLKLQMETSRPVVFLDGVTRNSNSYNDTSKYRVEHFPLIGEYIRLNYTMVLESNEQRVFVRNDRVK